MNLNNNIFTQTGKKAKECIYVSHLLMMNTVNMLVQPFCMQNPVSPIEYKILKDEVEEYLCWDYFPA